MTTAVVNFEGVRVVIACDERCGEQLALLLDTTDRGSAERLVREDVFTVQLETIATLLGWGVLNGVGRTMHRCPACERKDPSRTR